MEVARRFAAGGSQVTMMTSRPAGLPAVQESHGIRIQRRGSEYSLYLWVAWYLIRHAARYDAIIEFQNGIPFMAPLFAGRRPVVRVIHHVHQNQFSLRFRWPLSAIGRFLERALGRLVYRDNPMAVVSPSTRTEVRKRLGLRGPIYVVPNGTFPAPPFAGLGRSQDPLIVYVGRLVAHKRVDLLINAVSALKSKWPGIRLVVAGRGPVRRELERQVADAGLSANITFSGFISEEAKHELLGRSWLTVVPSDAEGWGLSVLEANAHGVPAVARRVPGLRDAIVDGVTGWLVDSADDFSSAIDVALGVLSNPERAERLSSECKAWATRFTWDETAHRLARIVQGELLSRAAVQGFTSRTQTDLVCVVDLPASEGDLVIPALHRLRLTDLRLEMGHGPRILLYGCDEVDAAAVLVRIGARSLLDIRMARTRDLLTTGARVAAPSDAA